MNELTISVDPHRKTPLYEQIYDYIKNDIQKKAGEKPVEIMEMREYGLGDGEAILKKCMKILDMK